MADADSSKRNGPKISIAASCFDCRFCKSMSYRAQGDSGSDVTCTHPSMIDGGRIGDSTWKTPIWCPFLRAELLELAKQIQRIE